MNPEVALPAAIIGVTLLAVLTVMYEVVRKDNRRAARKFRIDELRAYAKRQQAFADQYRDETWAGGVQLRSRLEAAARVRADMAEQEAAELENA